MRFFEQFMDNNPGKQQENQTNDRFFHLLFSLQLFCKIHFRIWKQSKDILRLLKIHIMSCPPASANPTGNYMFKVNNSRSGIFIVNFEHISHLVLVFLLLTLSRQMPAGKWPFFRLQLIDMLQRSRKSLLERLNLSIIRQV